MDIAAIEVGDRFVSRDARDAGRIVEVREVKDVPPYGLYFEVENEVHPRNPSAVGRKSTVSEKGLRTRFHRISR